MTTNKLVNFSLALGVKVLELVDGLELADVESIGEDAIGLAFEKMFALKGGDM